MKVFTNFEVSQNVIPSRGYLGGATPFAFTEQGIAMLSGVLNSDRAIQVNIEIMRTFVHLRKWISAHKDLVDRIDKLEDNYDEKFKLVFTALTKLIQKDKEPKKRIGYKDYDKE